MSFKINRVYTRSGDQGETGLVGGARVSKTDLRVRCYGEVDELNSWLGMAKSALGDTTMTFRPLLEYLQQELFDLGSELATPPKDGYEGMWKASFDHVETLEKLCDQHAEGLDELNSFILPGGSELASRLHVARTVCRRAERSAIELYESYRGERPEHEVSLNVVRYLNRLSDLLFILSRDALRKEGKKAPLWEKGEQRKTPI
jgi:cob(I)alamin adenosyltransferase